MTDPRIEEQVKAIMARADDFGRCSLFDGFGPEHGNRHSTASSRASLESALRQALADVRELALEDTEPLSVDRARRAE